jgi:hypothetical protein
VFLRRRSSLSITRPWSKFANEEYGNFRVL